MAIYSIFMNIDCSVRVEANSEEEAERIARQHIAFACDKYELDISQVKIDSVCEE